VLSTGTLFSGPSYQYIIGRTTISSLSTTTKAINVFYATGKCTSPT
jgi:hypothetical protein